MTATNSQLTDAFIEFHSVCFELIRWLLFSVYVEETAHQCQHLADSNDCSHLLIGCVIGVDSLSTRYSP